MKYNEFIKKIVSSAVALFMTATIGQGTLLANATDNDFSSAEINNNLYTTGDGIWESAEDLNIPLENKSVLDIKSLPSSVDNSTSVYFPSIGNQGQLNSCAGWATTYYQYSYEVNKMLGVSTTSNNVYSPSWTYNYINGGLNNPTTLSSAYEILKNHGAMKLADYTHPTLLSSYSFEWSSNTQKMVDALRYRVNRYYVYCSSSYDLYNVKNQLSNGKVGVIWTNSSGWTTTNTTTGDSIIIKGSSLGSGGHFMTVVGYDDNVTATYNGATFVGAFKLANSWGTSFGNDGYVWVAYDALNSTSILGNWETQANYRTQIFGGNNEVNFVNIETYNTYYVGRVRYVSTDAWHNNIYGDIGSSATTPKFTPSTYLTSNPADLAHATYKEILFDYFDNPNLNVGNYIHSQFTTKISNSTSNTTYRIYLSIMDNRCKTILPNDTVAGSLNGNGGSYSRTFSLNLKKGRISTYDNGNITNSDISALSSFLLGNDNLSTLQGYLADMNDDEVLDSTDLTLLLQAMSNQSTSINVMNVYLPEIGLTVREFITSQYGLAYLREVEALCTHAA